MDILLLMLHSLSKSDFEYVGDMALIGVLEMMFIYTFTLRKDVKFSDGLI